MPPQIMEDLASATACQPRSPSFLRVREKVTDQKNRIVNYYETNFVASPLVTK